MKYLFIVLLSAVQYTYACDFCGSSSNLSNVDVVGTEMQSFISASMMYKKFEFKDVESSVQNSHMMTNLLQGSYAPKSWVDMRINLPLIWLKNNYFENNTSFSEKKIALGDIQLLSNITVWQKQKTNAKKIYQKLNLGLGIELPTGKKLNSNYDILQNINFGSQSVDFLFNALYLISIKNWNIVQQAQTKINTYNQDKFKYGNNYAYQFLVNYIFYIKKSNITPAMSTRVDIASKNLNNNIIQSKSGLWLWSMQVGVEWKKNNYHLGCMIQQPIMQNTSNKLMQQKTLTNIYFKYLIKRNKK
ncbi:MAG: hypothetical protein IPK18_09840 [Sphingobacteriales bacterium]|nr:MAG: hypothetical protein IPK18_09840 [Sphingobacteriales bacterium]